MPDGHNPKHRNRKSVQLHLSSSLHGHDLASNSSDLSIAGDPDADFTSVPLTGGARSTAHPFTAVSYPLDDASSHSQHSEAIPRSRASHSHSNNNTTNPSFFSSFTLTQPRQMAMAAMSVISPRSSNYERLEGGMGPSRLGVPHQPSKGWRRFGWKKFAVGAAALIFVVWLWGPRESRLDWEKVKEGIKKPFSGGKGSGDNLIPPLHHEEDYGSPSSPSSPSSNKPSKAPLSFATDPNPSLTTLCTSPHSPSLPLVQYALMIDAGSTGSRIHIYKFNNCFASPSYEYEVFLMTQPGLSSFAGRPLEAAKSLDILLEKAVEVVPKDMWKCTPVAVKATAGLRLLPGRQSHDILEKVEERIREVYEFRLAERGGVVIMDGKDEGVYAWITANYLLGTIGAGSSSSLSSSSSKQEKSTYAVLDLGGASTQIVFEPTFPSSPSSSSPSSSSSSPPSSQTLVEGDHKYTLLFSGRTYELYQHSYLGYGLMRARSHVHRLVDFMAGIRPRPVSVSKFRPVDVDGDGEPDIEAIPNPCLARNTSREVEVKDEDTLSPTGQVLSKGATRKVWMSGSDIGSFAACTRIVQLVLAKDAVCEVKPCGFNGAYQPSILGSFEGGRVLLLSYFYDRLAPLLPPPSSSSKKGAEAEDILNVDTFAEVATKICAGPSAWAQVPHWASNKDLLSDIAGRPEYCLDLTFMHSLLRLGYEFEGKRRVDVGKKVGGTELGWCLGATIEMVGAGEVKCRV